ncbi:long-chain fatty acid--CoA ligase [Alkalispirochaeta odontotermitis]|nr:long-chain fatty acid--CoA ligase [Alkalispirochaeta odontotermitis]CAB1084361.1 Long-chain-fatty-acid--CoA ligase (EC [Olavius algarvensis Delta 1 endosymbiont]
MVESADTFPKILLDNVKKFGDGKTAIREKGYGIWQSFSWQDYHDHVRDFALGLASLGFKRGDKLAIIGDNRPQLYWGMAAAQSIGGVPVSLYQDAIEGELEFILKHSEARFALAEDQEQSDKLLSLKQKIPNIEYIIYNDPKGMRNYSEPFLMNFDDVQELGRKFAVQNPAYFKDEIDKGNADDLAVICYTSGTTGNPKGVLLPYHAVVGAARSFVEFEGLTENEEIMAYLPMAWIGDHIFSYGEAMVAGFTPNCPENTSTVVSDMREIGPTYLFCPPRIWENMLTQVMIKIEDAAWIKRKMFHYFMSVAEKVEKIRIANKPVPIGLKTLYQLGRVLVYGPLTDNLGMKNVRVAYTAGEAIGPEIFEFFRSLGINLKQLYGMTESCALVSIQKDGDIESDTVGTPVPGVDIKISDNGEVLYKSPGNFTGYFKNDEATAETLVDGYVLSGDAGYVTRHGHLKIIDRAKDVSKLTDGTLFAPKFIENKLKFSPFIKEAVAHGQNRDFVTAFIDIDYGAVGNWAERKHIPYTSYTDLAQKPEVYDLVDEAVQRVNKSLGEDEKLKNAQIKRFLLLHKELDPDDGEITRTRKVRRKFIDQKYDNLIDALFTGKDKVTVDATFTYEDGRTVTMKADLKIRDAETF